MKFRTKFSGPGDEPKPRKGKSTPLPSENKTNDALVTHAREALIKDGAFGPDDIHDVTREHYMQFKNDRTGPLLNMRTPVRLEVIDEFERNPKLDAMTAGYLNWGKISQNTANQHSLGYDPGRTSTVQIGNRVQFEPDPIVTDVASGPMLAPREETPTEPVQPVDLVKPRNLRKTPELHVTRRTERTGYNKNGKLGFSQRKPGWF